MPISINPIFPVIAAQAAAPDLVLQPGTAIDAQVLKILADNLVRIAVANLSIEVLSEVPLRVGQTLQLAVSQTADGIKLAVVGQSGVAAQQDRSAPPGENRGRSGAPSFRAAAVVPDIVDGAVATPPDESLAKQPLSPLQALAVSAAAQAAATRQGSLAPLFANLDAVVFSEALPPQLQQAVSKVLAVRPRLHQDLEASDVKAAFEKSGLFLEASLASARTAPSPGGAPDLKAGLIVLRQTLQALGQTAVSENARSTILVTPQPPVSGPLDAEIMPAARASAASIAASSTVAPSLLPEIDVDEVLLPQARLPAADDFSKSSIGNTSLAAPPRSALLRTTSTGAVLNLQEQAQPGLTQQTGLPTTAGEAAQSAPRNHDPAVRTNVPPPPFRGALPSAQPVVGPSLAPDAPLALILHRLADETEAAIARQTLLQLASLPDRADIASSRADPPAPRWNFEVPFATAIGTAIAQFEISQDGSRSPIEAAARVWQARFSLDLEPAGPVHALVSLANDRTSVRMWAERSGTAEKLQAGMLHLSEALSRAQLQPGDIVIRHGAPMQSAAAAAGLFLDREL